MNAQNQLIIDMIEKINSKKISLETAIKVLNVSRRTVFRYMKGFSEFGISYFNHGNKNRAPKNKTSAKDILKSKELMMNKYKELMMNKYFDFNVTHALEKLKAEENILINREIFRKICHEINLVKKEKRRRGKIRKLRCRTPQSGVMLQMDGSHHHWFNALETCLIGTIDDADNENNYSEFFDGETTVGCLQVLKRTIEKKGIFSILYTDRAGLFAGPKRAEFSQVKRALAELGIQIIYANSAQAKGRIERHWATVQDRLAPELRLQKIKTIEAANQYLQEVFLPNDYNKKFKVVPSNLESGWQPIPAGIDLNEIFCLKYLRVVKSDHTFSFNSQQYLIKSDLKYSIEKQKIEIRIYLDGVQKIYFSNQELEVKAYQLPAKMSVDDKFILLQEENDTIKVRKDSHVFYQSKFYSVDASFIGAPVVVKEYEGNLLFYYRKKLIETHQKIKSKFMKSSTKSQHLKPWQDTLLTTSVYRLAAKKIGPHCDKLIFTILQKGQGLVDNKTIWGIISLAKSYPYKALDEACEFSLNSGAVNYQSVMNYLQLRCRKSVNI